ncbi:MAG TPA: DNA polymerase ligase N-terminal domain-containing protein [Chitinophagaceae bacterium]|jgi:bifunctional non-homologous end joining protein LigD
MTFDFTIELDGMRSWTVPQVPSMNPLDHRPAKEEDFEFEHLQYLSANHPLTEADLRTWDKGNYIPMDDWGNVLSEKEALEALQDGALKFFLQGKKLVGQFVLLKKDEGCWLLIKRHDEFALYSSYSYEAIAG